MSFSYHGDPADSTVDAVRFLIGDTEEVDHLIEDEEISWALTQEPDTFFAAALVADSLSANFSGRPTSQTIGETSVTYGEQTSKFSALARQLRNTRRMQAVAPFGSGWSKSAKDTVESDTDREQLVARKTDVPEVNVS